MGEKMAHLETLNTFFCDRLLAAASEIFQVVKDTFSQYQEEIDRCKQENVYLREMLAEVSINNRPGSTGAEDNWAVGFPPEETSSEEAENSETSLIQVNMKLSTMHQNLSPDPQDADEEQQPAADPPTRDGLSEPSEDVVIKVEDIDVKMEHGEAHAACSDEVISCPVNRENQLHPNSQDFCNLPFHLQSSLQSKVRRKPLRSDGNPKGRKITRSKQKKLRCDLCWKWYSTPHSLKTHLRTHTGERPFPCKFCVKTFHQKAHLKEHERTHTGEKPFSCSVCGKHFSRSQQVRVHIHYHHQHQAAAIIKNQQCS